MYRLVLMVIATLLVVDAKHLPSYITACKKDDPNLNQCAVEHALHAVKTLVKGDKEYNLPSLSPLHVPLIVLKPSADFTIKLTDALVEGLENVQIEDIKIDLLRKEIKTRYLFKSVIIEGKYEMNGRLLLLPITGNGVAKITYENVAVDYFFSYKLITQNGKEYFDPKSFVPVASYTTDKIGFKFDNLFNGDKNLGDRTNEFLNEHAEEINEEFSFSIAETIKAIVLDISKKIVPEIPFAEFFV